MQDCIGRAAHRHVQDKGVIQRFFTDNIERLDIFFDKGHNLFARSFVKLLPFRVNREDCPIAGQRHSYRLAKTVHRIGGEHPRTTSLGRAAGALKLGQLGLVDFTGVEFGHTLEYGDKVNRFSRLCFSGRHRSA